MQNPTSTAPTERLVARLASEGWVECPNLGFPALCQRPSLNLHRLVLEQLIQAGNRLWEVDLQLSALVFAIADHEFQVHPHLPAVLKQLESEHVIEIREQEKPTLRGLKTEREIVLKVLKSSRLHS